MAMGEWLSVNNSREMTRRQIDEEKQRVIDDPDAERRELSVIYQGKGLDQADADALASRIFKSEEAAVDTLAREALGADPDELGGSAWVAGASSFFMFAVGAIFPVVPLLFADGGTAQVVSVIVSGLALILVGLVTARFTGRSLVFSAGRQLIIGLAAAGVTYGAGHLIGVTIG